MEIGNNAVSLGNSKFRLGFTILEILIVLLILAITASLAILSIGNVTHSKFNTDANKLALMLELINDEAVYSNSTIICKINLGRLICQRYRDEEWQDLDLSKVTSWQQPDNIYFKQVYVNSKLLKDGEAFRFVATGNLDPLSFLINDDSGHRTWIVGDLNGNFKLSN